MNVDKLYVILRQLAKTHEYQSLYSTAKELHFKIFKNDRDLTDIQFTFLSYLNFYATIFMDIYLKEIDEKVLEHIIYEDAYIHYKNKASKEKFDPEKIREQNQYHSGLGRKQQKQIKSKWHFKQRR